MRIADQGNESSIKKYSITSRNVNIYFVTFSTKCNIYLNIPNLVLEIIFRWRKKSPSIQSIVQHCPEHVKVPQIFAIAQPRVGFHVRVEFTVPFPAH